MGVHRVAHKELNFKDGGKANHTRFTSDPQMTSQNDICSMRLLIWTPTHTRFPIRQKMQINLDF